MTNPQSGGRTIPTELSVTELKSSMMDTLDAARFGHATIISRNGRAIAGLVPVEVARAYMANADLGTQLRAELAAEVDLARDLVDNVLQDLGDKVRGGPPVADDTSGGDGRGEHDEPNTVVQRRDSEPAGTGGA